MPRGYGSDDEFAALYCACRLDIYRVCRGIVLDSMVAEDLAQETFEKAFRAMQDRECPHPRALLHRIAVNLSISYIRRRRVGEVVASKLFGDPGHGPAGFEAVEARTLTVRALAALTPPLRAVVVLAFYADMNRNEIAATLGIPPGTVGSRMDAAMQQMRRVLGGAVIAGVEGNVGQRSG